MTDTTEGEGQQQEQQQEQKQAPEPASSTPTPQEADARKMGWRPEEEWDDSGTANWLPAAKYLERNERLAKRGDRILQADVARLTRQNTSLENTLGELKEYLTKADNRALQKARKELEAKADKAVEEGDTDAYRHAKVEMKDLEQEAKAEAKAQPAKKPAAANPDDDPEFQGWLPDNTWYDPKDDGFDAELAAFADSVAPQIGRTGLVGKPFYERIATEVKKKFPDRFGNQRRKQAQAVEGGGRGGGGNGKTLWAEVGKDGHEAFKNFVGQGIYKDTREDREKYADVYING